jgi:hypothetical protein
MFTLVLRHPNTFPYIIWIIQMETKQYGTNILVSTMGRQAYQHTYAYNKKLINLFHFLFDLSDVKN